MGSASGSGHGCFATDSLLEDDSDWPVTLIVSTLLVEVIGDFEILMDPTALPCIKVIGAFWLYDRR